MPAEVPGDGVYGSVQGSCPFCLKGLPGGGEARRILSENRYALDRIAEFLIEQETITGKEFMRILEEVRSEQGNAGSSGVSGESGGAAGSETASTEEGEKGSEGAETEDPERKRSFEEARAAHTDDEGRIREGFRLLRPPRQIKGNSHPT